MILGIIGISLVLSGFVIYTVQNSDRINNFAVGLQLFVSQWQTLAVFSYLDFPWPSYFQYITGAIDAFADVRIFDVSFGDCLLAQLKLKFTEKYVLQISLLLEVFITFAITKAAITLSPTFMLRQGDKGKARNPLPLTNTRLVVTSTLVTLFFLFQALLFYSFGMLDCRTVEYSSTDSRQYLAEDASVDCTSSSYRSVRGVALPFALILLFGVPGSLWLAYYVHRGIYPHLSNERYQCGSCLLGGGTKSAWFWPLIIFVRKGLSVAVVVLTDFPLDSLLCSWMLLLQLGLQMYIRPYHRRAHQRAEGFGIAAVVLCIAIANLYRIAGTTIPWVVPLIAPTIILIETASTVSYIYFMSDRFRVKFNELAKGYCWDVIEYVDEDAEAILLQEEEQTLDLGDTVERGRPLNSKASKGGSRLATRSDAEFDEENDPLGLEENAASLVVSAIRKNVSPQRRRPTFSDDDSDEDGNSGGLRATTSTSPESQRFSERTENNDDSVDIPLPPPRKRFADVSPSAPTTFVRAPTSMKRRTDFTMSDRPPSRPMTSSNYQREVETASVQPSFTSTGALPTRSGAPTGRKGPRRPTFEEVEGDDFYDF